MQNRINEISFRRKQKIFILYNYDHKQETIQSNELGTLLVNIANLGYTFSDDLIKEILNSDQIYLKEFYNWLVPVLKKSVGDHKQYRPMYPNFPQQVINASDAELYINAILHYFGDVVGLRIMPDYEKEIRSKFKIDLSKLKVIGLCDIKDAEKIYTEILSAKSSPSVQDKEDLQVFIDANFPTFLSAIENRETLAFCTGYSFTRGLYNEFTEGKFIKTSTDILRVIVAMSDGDISLAKVSKFKKFKRPVRKAFLCMLDELNVEQAAEDMMRYRSMWKRAGEILHPGEFSSKFKNAYEMFRLIRNEGQETYYAKLNKAENKDVREFVYLLSLRPGEFVRRLDYLARRLKLVDFIKVFNEVKSKVSTQVLWQAYAHFNGREQLVKQNTRIFFPKGNITKPLVAYNNLRIMNSTIIDTIKSTIYAGIIEQYRLKPELGKVYIDDVVSKLVMPSNNRSASSSLRTVGRGSRFKLDPAKSTVRLFMWWKDQKGDNGSGSRGYGYCSRVDLDLSAIQYDKDWNYLGHCSWTNLRYNNDEGSAMVHSGDITSAPNGASEFLDINLDKLENKVAYIVTTVYSYTGQQFSELQEAFAGWMMRDCPNSGEIYEPASVEGRVDLRSECTQIAPIVLDVHNREIIWTDMTTNEKSICGCVERSKGVSAIVGDAISRFEWSKPLLADIFLANLLARKGRLVAIKEDAEFVIAEDGDLSPYDSAKIMSEWV